MSKLIEFITPLVTRDGVASHTKVWSNIAYGVATWIIVHLTLNNRLTEDYLMWYLAIVAGHTTVSKYLASKGKKNDEQS